MKSLSNKFDFAPFKPDVQLSELLKNGYVQVLFWSFIGLLVFIQDYVDSTVNNHGYYISESLAFKCFWLLFIPISILWFKILDLAYSKQIRSRLTAHSTVIVAALTMSFIHLLLFALLLTGISRVFLTASWSFTWILTDAIAERFYFPFSTYLIFAIVYLGFKRRESIKVYPKKLSIKHGKKSYLVDLEDIKWISVENSVTRIHTDFKKYIYQGSLNQILKELNPNHFKRIHRSTIIRINAVRQTNSRLNGDYDVEMKDGTILRLSRNYVKAVKTELF